MIVATDTSEDFPVPDGNTREFMRSFGVFGVVLVNCNIEYRYEHDESASVSSVMWPIVIPPPRNYFPQPTNPPLETALVEFTLPHDRREMWGSVATTLMILARFERLCVPTDWRLNSMPLSGVADRLRSGSLIMDFLPS